MSLLPKSHTQFSQADYWEQFFKKRGGKAFEWYGEYGELCGILHKYIKNTDKILNVGCGNSTLSEDLYDVGYKNIINIDISDVAIRQMTDKNLQKRPDMKFMKMDVYNMELNDGEFSVVLDKGTLDAIMTDEEPATIENVNKMFGEISRVMRVGGRYVCVSLAQSHIVKKILEYFPSEGWMVRVCRAEESGKEEKKEFHMPVFVFVLTKFKKMPNFKPVLETAFFADSVERFDSVEKVQSAITEVQHYGVIRQQLENKYHINEQLSLELYSSESKSPRYILHVVDSPKTQAKQFGIFIVPEGKETEWLFSSDNGRLQLADSAGFERLIVVSLHRDHTYTDLDSIQKELSGKVMELAPARLSTKKQVPFLSIGNDINKRSIKYHGKSEMSGKFVVEDVDCDNQIQRRLIFLSTDRIIQSSARLKKEISRRKSGKSKAKQVVDHSFLQCTHHSIMSAGLVLLENFQEKLNSGISLLLIGLGGGGLPMFLRKHVPALKLDVVDIDPSIAKVATEWFGLVEDEKLKVHIADGLEFINKEEKKGTKWDIIALDVNSNDSSAGMSCPPQVFVELGFLKILKSALTTNGIFMLNLVCRDTDIKVSVMKDIKSVFTNVSSKAVPDEINEIIFASTSETVSKPPGEVETSLSKLQDVVKANSRGAEVPKLTDMLKEMSVV